VFWEKKQVVAFWINEYRVRNYTFMKSRHLYLWPLVLIILGLFSSFAHADTNVSSFINSDTTLTLSGSPYIVFGTVTIASGATLSVDPGVIIKFGFNGMFVVNGRLDVNGTVANPVNFTSWSDDSLGGDSNGDGSATGPAGWNGIIFFQDSVGNISNLIIQYGGQNNQNSDWSEISNLGTLSITNSVFKNAMAGYGFRQRTGTSTIVSTEFGDGIPQDVAIENGVADIRSSHFHGSNEIALLAKNSSIVNLEDSTFDGNLSDTVDIYFPSKFTHKNNHVSGNHINGFAIDGIINSDIKLTNDNGIPYLFGHVTVSPNTTLTIDPDTIVKFYGNGWIQVTGTLNVNGTTDHSVFFASINDDLVGGDTYSDGNATPPAPRDWQLIVALDGGVINMSHADVAYGGGQGYFWSDWPAIGNNGGTVNLDYVKLHDNNVDIHNTAGTTTVQHSIILPMDSRIGVYYEGGSLSIHNSSITGGPSASSVITYYYVTSSVDATNNWWGDPSGPNHYVLNPSGTGIGVGDHVDFTPWLTSDPFATSTPLVHTPVLIIPGVLGTEIFKGPEELWMDFNRTISDIGDQFMDPLQFDNSLLPIDTSLSLGNVIDKVTIGSFTFDYSSGLINEFKSQGYTEGSSSVDNLFLFPYDWRHGVDENIVNLLKQKIQEIRSQTGSDKIDIIAHSTGGLLVKKYVTGHPTDNHIEKAVFVGVPNTGAPKAIKVLLEGDGFDNPFLSDNEMKKIAKNLPVVYDLSPSQQYYDQKGSFVKIINQGLLSLTSQDLNFSQTKDYLANDHGLNSQAISNAGSLHNLTFDNYDLRTAGVDLYSIVGCKTGTIGKVIEKRAQNILGGTSISYALEETPGDGTVPLESATNLPVNSSNKYYALKADHGQMMTQYGIRQEIVNIISGSNLSVDSGTVTQDISKCKLNGKAISVFSPLSLNIVDQNGNRSGLDAAGNIFNDIPNADFEVMGDHKFVYLPTDDGQTYSISLNGTGVGAFTLQDSDVTDNQITNTETFADIPVTTSLKGGLDLGTSVLSLDSNGDGQTDFKLQGIPNKTTIMPYTFSGFLQPINDTKYYPSSSLSVFKAGSTVPVKFQIKKYDGTIVQATNPPEWLAPLKGPAMSVAVGESVYTTTGTSGNTYKWDADSKQYIYNWSTKGLTAGFWYKIYAKLDDGNMYSVTVGLK
jgi:hypothetical protein